MTEPHTNRPRIILDCDPGLDDAFAIFTAARFADVVAITTVNGNVDIDKTTRNALVVAQVAGLDVPVHRGASQPLKVPAHDAGHVHGDSGLGGPTLPALTRDVASDDAVSALFDHTAGGDVTVVAIGPLTNIALAIQADPTWVQRVPEISLMGGSTGIGNVTAAAEFNIWADPHAAQVVFESGVRLRMLGLNLTHQVEMGQVEEDRLRAIGTESAIFGADLLAHYSAFTLEQYGVRRGAMHDPCAVLCLTHPELFGFADRHVTVEAEGEHTRGATIVDQRSVTPDPNVAVGMTAEGSAVVDLIVEAAASPTPV